MPTSRRGAVVPRTIATPSPRTSWWAKDGTIEVADLEIAKMLGREMSATTPHGVIHEMSPEHERVALRCGWVWEWSPWSGSARSRSRCRIWRCACSTPMTALAAQRRRYIRPRTTPNRCWPRAQPPSVRFASASRIVAIGREWNGLISPSGDGEERARASAAGRPNRRRYAGRWCPPQAPDRA